MSSFTLLDDCEASDSQPVSRLYTELQQELICLDAGGFDAMMTQLQQGLNQGLYAVGVFSYELGVELQGIDINPAAQPSRILLYQQCRQLNRDQVDHWLVQQGSGDAVAGIAQLIPSVDEDQFCRAIASIQDYIAAGDTYQVNYTFRFQFKTYGHLCALYQRLRERQSVPYGALIALPDGSAVLSLSPELFVRHQQGAVTVCPMKGTAAAFVDGTEAENEQVNALLSRQLSEDGKNRAENVMIVDLLRNDLSRIARLGTVQVTHLFQVQRFNAVLQMTSGVSAIVREDVDLSGLFRAIYPCGSITGAPKYRTMQIIQELETEPRGIYTGAIGWFDPPGDAQQWASSLPDFCLSVPIRTLHVQAADSDGTRSGVMGVGAGIVFDSVAADEYQESLLKARFLTELPAQFSLFETMHATSENGCRQVERHLQRIERSAHFFGIPIQIPQVRRQLDLVCAELEGTVPYRLKLSLDGAGKIQIQTGVLVPLPSPVRIMLAPIAQSSHNLWLRHKTSMRQAYDQAWQTAERHGAFDMLFCNERGEITEGGRSTVLVKIDGRWFTPFLNDGVLPGVMRAVLMSDPAWMVSERSMTLAELNNAEEFAVCNALRGVLKATLSDG